MMSRIGCLVPVRLGSERLPGKALLPVDGKPMLLHLFERAAACRFIAEPRNVILCTTTDSGDDAVVEVASHWGATVFRGERDDILGRFLAAAQTHGLDICLEIDGDDPLADPQYMDLCIQHLLDHPQTDYVHAVGLPIGLAPRAFTTAALARAKTACLSERNDTGYGHMFTRTGLFQVTEISPQAADHVCDGLRLTIDYPEDMEMLRGLVARLSIDGQSFGIGDIVRLLRKEPELSLINSGLEETYWQRTRQLGSLSYHRDGRVHVVSL
jgi:spore coat polysaccharide biosynthesis protein SpsF